MWAFALQALLLNLECVLAPHGRPVSAFSHQRKGSQGLHKFMPRDPNKPRGGQRQKRRIEAVERKINTGELDPGDLYENPSRSLAAYSFTEISTGKQYGLQEPTEDQVHENRLWHAAESAKNVAGRQRRWELKQKEKEEQRIQRPTPKWKDTEWPQ